MKTLALILAPNLTIISGFYADVKKEWMEPLGRFDSREHAVSASENYAKNHLDRKFVVSKAQNADIYILFEMFAPWQEVFYAGDESTLIDSGAEILCGE